MIKQVVIFSLIALTIGTTVFLLSNRGKETRVNTIYEWYTCRSNSHYKICDDIIGTQKELDQCYQAATDFASVCYPDHTNTTSECSNFWQFYYNSASDAVLPDEYFTCVNQGLSAAKESNFFYKNNYQLLWVNCATTQA